MAEDFQAVIERTEHNLEAVEKAEGIRREHFCYHCGYFWRGYRGKRPRNCARCHVVNFDRPPKHRDARRPGDEPNPNWKQRQRPLKLPPKEEVVSTEPEHSVPGGHSVVTGEHGAVEQTSAASPKLPLYLRAPFSVPALTPRTGLPPPPRLARLPARPQPELMPEQISSHGELTDANNK